MTLRAQQNTDTPMFRLQVRRVPVDVVVLDKNGNPVRGLRKDDFIIKENGKPQHVLSFDKFDGAVPNFVPPKLPPLPANTFMDIPSSPERGPLYILYYDMVNTAQDDQMTFRSELLKFVDNAPPGVRIAVFVNAAGLHLLQGFTIDHARLHDAIVRKGPGPHLPQVFLDGNVYGRYDASAALSNLNFIAEYMNGIPGRKNLIWLASYFPIPVGPTLVGSGAMPMASAPSVAGSTGAGGGPEVLDLSELLKDAMKRTYSNMMKTQMALYPVSLGGVGSPEEPRGGDTVANDQNMDSIAAATGGRAFHGNNFAHNLIDQAIVHGETYYTLSYEPSNSEYNGDARTIEVSLARKNKDYHLTYRETYYAMSDEDTQTEHKKEPLQARFLAAKSEDTLYATIEHGAPMVHDLLFSAHLAAEGTPHLATPEQMHALEDSPAYFKTRRRDGSVKPVAPVKLQKYVIDYGVVDPQLKAMAAHRQKEPALEFAAAVYDDDGRLLNSMLNRGVPSGVKGKTDALFHAIQEVEAPPGAAYIRLAVRDVATNRTGTVEVKLPVQPETTRQDAMQTAPAAPARN
jgi:VWFA-related protein